MRKGSWKGYLKGWGGTCVDEKQKFALTAEAAPPYVFFFPSAFQALPGHGVHLWVPGCV